MISGHFDSFSGVNYIDRWVDQKVCSACLVTSEEKTQSNFLANPIHEANWPVKILTERKTTLVNQQPRISDTYKFKYG